MSQLRWTKLLTLILLVGVMVAVLAANQSKTLFFTRTPTQEPGSTLKTPGAIALAAPNSQTAPEENSGPGPVGLVRYGPTSAPSGMGLIRLGNASPSFTPQIAPTESGLTVTVNQPITVEANGAYVVVVPPTIFGPSGNPQSISREDHAAVIAKLEGIGIAREDIEITSVPYGPSSVSAEVQISELPQVGQLVLDAVESVLGRSDSYGVRFSLSPEKCDQALAQARRQAVPQADKTATDLAQALGTQLGSVISAVEYPYSYFGYGPYSPSACGNQQDPYQDPFLVEPFDAEPELQVAVNLQVTYAIETTAEPAVEPPAGP